MKRLILFLGLFYACVCVGEPTAEDFQKLQKAFHEAGCRPLDGNELAEKHSDHEYDMYLRLPMTDRGPMVILVTKTAVFSAQGIIDDDSIAIARKGKRKVKLSNGFTEEWEVWEESSSCTKMWKSMINMAKPKKTP